ncbi:MAG: asparagine synthase [Gammaproteobacteria bacterium]|nr:asparagine synthase [Gammaproteobacteria bacterium]
MNGLFGWSGGAASDSGQLRQRLLKTVADQTNTGAVYFGVHTGAANQPPTSRTAYCDGSLVAALAGRVTWKDKALSDLAKQRGNHAALAQAFRQSGDQCVQLISGHFSFAVLDTEKNSALLAVDRIGAYPLCYSVTNDGTLIFGSDTDVVKAHPNVSGTLSQQALYDYLYFHMVPSPDTIYRDIKKLQPAQVLRFENGRAHLSFYWQPDFVDGDGVNSLELQDTLLKTLRESVRRCEPDDTTGAFLSGGTDSSTVSGMLAGLQSKPAKTYSIGFSQEGYDEISYARIASRHFHTDQHEYYVTPKDVAEAFPKVARAYDEPFGNSSAIPTYFCAQLARRDGTRVLLAGDGGDELFGGNARYAKQKLFEAYHHVPQWLRSGLVEPLFVGLPFAQWLPPTRKIRSYIEQARMPMPDRMESYNLLQRTDPRSMFNADFFAQCDTRHPLAVLRDTWQRAPTQSLLHRMLFLDWKVTLADNDLRKVNRMCALQGVEVRYPMLDDELLEFSARVPPNLKLKGQQLRYFFKKSLGNFLPHEIIHKKKHGFGLPFGEWLKTSPELQDVVHTNLRSFKTRGLLQEQYIDNLIIAHRDGHAAYYGTLIWVLAMLEQWFQQHKVNP